MSETSAGDTGPNASGPDPSERTEVAEPAAPLEPTEAAEPAAPATPAPRIPAAALSDRNAIARAKGLPDVMIQGGHDPTPEVGRHEERRYMRLLIAMVVVIVLAGFVLGYVGLIVGGPTPS